MLLGRTDMNVGYILCEDQLHRYFSRFGNVLDGAFCFLEAASALPFSCSAVRLQCMCMPHFQCRAACSLLSVHQHEFCW